MSAEACAIFIVRSRSMAFATSELGLPISIGSRRWSMACCFVIRLTRSSSDPVLPHPWQPLRLRRPRIGQPMKHHNARVRRELAAARSDLVAIAVDAILSGPLGFSLAKRIAYPRLVASEITVLHGAERRALRV